MAEFVFKMHDNSLVKFDDWDKIPSNFKFKHVIKFLPDMIPEPHDDHEHEEMSLWNERLQTLMEKERAGNM